MCKARTNFIENVVQNAQNIRTVNALDIDAKIVKQIHCEGEVTTATVGVNILGQVFLGFGEAKCNPRDEYNYVVGEHIAVARAASSIWRMFTGRQHDGDIVIRVSFEQNGITFEEI